MSDGIVAITGASGHVGGNLARALLARGRPLRLLMREDVRAIQGLGAEMIKADVLDLSSLERAFSGAEVVYHLAARISIVRGETKEVRRVNELGTRHVVEACLRCGVRRLVHFSSIHALSVHPRGKPMDETHPLAEGQGVLAYDRSKAAGEREVSAGIQRGLDAVIVNPTAVLGPHDYKPSAMGDVLLKLARGKFFALVEGGFDWVDVRDVVQGAIAAEERGRCGERYLLSGHWCSFMELAGRVEKVSGRKAPAWTAPLWLAYLGAPFVETYSRLTGDRPLYTSTSLRILAESARVSSEKAQTELGYGVRPLSDTIRDTLDWFHV